MDIFLMRYDNKEEVEIFGGLLNDYTQDDMAKGEGAMPIIAGNLVPNLRARPWIQVFLALDHYRRGAGFCVSIESFSTFKNQSILNVHDLFVKKEVRGKGIGTALLRAIEDRAKELDCCKITLEVLENNLVAKKLYSGFGFQPYQLSQETGIAQFWQKELISNFS